MTAVSAEIVDRSRKNVSLVLQRIAQTGQQVLADCTGTSVSTISRWQSGETGAMGLEQVCMVFARIGLKLVPTTHVCVDRKMYGAMSHIAQAAMADEEIAQKLTWEES